MSGDRYLIKDQNDFYFLTFTVVDWIDVFSREDYRLILVDALNYCSENKGLRVQAWVIMTNHVHIICRVEAPNQLSQVIRDYKKHTSKAIVSKMKEIHESRKEWILSKLSFEAKRTGRAKNYKLWKDDNHAIQLDNIDIWQKINYIHANPVVAGWVNRQSDYIYSSARDYEGVRGLVKLDKAT